jgi:hypothetical protein
VAKEVGQQGIDRAKELVVERPAPEEGALRDLQGAA